MSLSRLASLVSTQGKIYASVLGYFCRIQQQQGTSAFKKQTFVCSLNHLFGQIHMLNIATTF